MLATRPAPKFERFTETLHILVLWAFAVAQPLYDLIARYPTFLTAHQVESTRILWLASWLSLGLPGLLVASEWLVGLAGRMLRRALHQLMVSILAAAIAMPWLTRIEALPESIIVVSILGCGVLALMAYRNLESFAEYSDTQGKERPLL